MIYMMNKKNGGGRIRTHGRLLTYNGFQDRRLKPLGHSSKGISLYYIFLDNASTFFKKFHFLFFAAKYYYICTGSSSSRHSVLTVRVDRIFYTVAFIFIFSTPAIYCIRTWKFITFPFHSS